ncbi:DNA-deoxyinosine glycosylase, partial [Flavobacterium sp. WLB]
FLKQHPKINTILFNGQKAAAFFKKYVHLKKEYILITLPSTSPANAGKSFQSKLEEWKVIEEII